MTDPADNHNWEQIALLRRRLMSQAALFEDPQAYVAGVEDTLAAVTRLLDGEEITVVVPEVQPAGRMI